MRLDIKKEELVEIANAIGYEQAYEKSKGALYGKIREDKDTFENVKSVFGIVPKDAEFVDYQRKSQEEEYQKSTDEKIGYHPDSRTYVPLSLDK